MEKQDYLYYSRILKRTFENLEDLKKAEKEFTTSKEEKEKAKKEIIDLENELATKKMKFYEKYGCKEVPFFGQDDVLDIFAINKLLEF